MSSRTSRSRPVKTACLRLNHSRRRRLARLRSTARGRKRFGTTKPSREYSNPFGLIWTETEPARCRRVAERTRATASPRSRCAFRYRSAHLKRRGVRALSPAARGLPLSRRACSYGPETRACACDVRRTAEKCASWFFQERISNNPLLDDVLTETVNGKTTLCLWITRCQKGRIPVRLTCPKRPRPFHAKFLGFLSEPL